MTKPRPLTPFQVQVLAELGKSEPSTPTIIANTLKLNITTVSSVLDRLEVLGLAYSHIERTTCKQRFYMCGACPTVNETDVWVANRPHRTSWAPHHVRDSLVAALFGEASPA